MKAAVRVSGREDARAVERLLLARGYAVLTGAAASGEADLLVVDEWTSEDAPWVRAARERGTPVTVLAELVLGSRSGPVVGVTGTAGKTSTSRALAHLLRACAVPVCISDTARSGNAWPDHSLARPLPDGAVLVAELTSTHLCHMGDVSVDVGVVTMVRPDHVELHGSVGRYYAAKRRLVDAVPAGAPLVLPVDDGPTLAALGIDDEPTWGFGDAAGGCLGAFRTEAGRVLLRSPQGDLHVRCPLHGTAARAVLAACAAALALGVDAGLLGGALEDVPAPAHRMAQRVLPDGTTLIDNTMAATPLKVMAGLADAPPGPLVLVVGGDPSPTGARVHASPEERRALMTALEAARERADALIAFGPAAADISSVVHADSTAVDIRDALAQAMSARPDGGTLMVAPMFPMSPDDRDFVAEFGLPR